jgi:hypothetical protein
VCIRGSFTFCRSNKTCRTAILHSKNGRAPHDFSRGARFLERSISRILCPVRAAIIYLGALLRAPSSNLPGICASSLFSTLAGLRTRGNAIPPRKADAARVAPSIPYLVLHPVGFSLPVLSPEPRCALTAPFHPYLISLARAIGGSFSVALSRALTPPAERPDGWPLATTVPCGVRTFLPAFTERSPDHSESMVAGSRV